MGIEKLYSFIKEYAPDCISELSLDKLEVGMVALDGSSFYHKTKNNCMGDAKQIATSLWRTCQKLIQYKLIPILVFDGKEVPVPEKAIISQRREKRKMDVCNKIALIKKKTKLLANVNDEDVLKAKLVSKNDLEWLQKIVKEESYLKVLKKLEKYDQTKVEDEKKIIKQVISNLESKGIFCILAEAEADFIIAHMYKSGYIKYAFADDGDLFAFGVGKLVRNLKEHLFDSSKLLQVYDLKVMLECLKISHTQFIEMCILAKCDYCPIGLNSIGCVRAYRGIVKFNTLKQFIKKGQIKNSQEEIEQFYQCAKRAKKLFCKPRSEDYFLKMVTSNEVCQCSSLRRIIYDYVLEYPYLIT